MSYQALNLVNQIRLLGTKSPNTPYYYRGNEAGTGYLGTAKGRKRLRMDWKNE